MYTCYRRVIKNYFIKLIFLLYSSTCSDNNIVSCPSKVPLIRKCLPELSKIPAILFVARAHIYAEYARVPLILLRFQRKRVSSKKNK